MTLTREQAKLSVGDGWASLIDNLYDAMPEWTEVSDVKEKWGGLRISAYTDGVTQDLIDELEEKSLDICETCGKDGRTISLRGWYKTLCEGCEDAIKSKWHIE